MKIIYYEWYVTLTTELLLVLYTFGSRNQMDFEESETKYKV